MTGAGASATRPPSPRAAPRMERLLPRTPRRFLPRVRPGSGSLQAVAAREDVAGEVGPGMAKPHRPHLVVAWPEFRRLRWIWLGHARIRHRKSRSPPLVRSKELAGGTLGVVATAEVEARHGGVPVP